MTRVLVAAVVALSLVAAYLSYKQAEAAKDEAARYERALDARKAQHEAQRRLDASREELDNQLKGGGDEGLSPYMRDAASKLWP